MSQTHVITFMVIDLLIEILSAFQIKRTYYWRISTILTKYHLACAE